MRKCVKYQAKSNACIICECIIYMYMKCVPEADKMHCCVTSLQDAGLTYPLLCIGFPASCAAGSFIQVAERA